MAESAPFVSNSDPFGCSIKTDIILREESKGNTQRYFTGFIKVLKQY